MATQQKNPKTQGSKIVTPVFRVSFPSVFKAVGSKFNPDRLMFSVQMLFRTAKSANQAPGDVVVDLKPVKDAAAQVLVQMFGSVDKRPPKMRRVFRLGTETKKKDMDGFGEGVEFITASSKRKPGLYDHNKQEIIDPNEFYGGCYARASIVPYWYGEVDMDPDSNANMGIGWRLVGIQKAGDGDPFGGGSSPDDFETIAEPVGAVAAAGAAAAKSADPLGDSGL